MKIIVPTCKAYLDAAVPFAYLLGKFWPERQRNDSHLLVAGSMPDDDNLGVWPQMRVGWNRGDDGFSSTVMNWLRCRKSYEGNTDIVLLMQEDFFLNASVDDRFVRGCEALMLQQPNIACIRLYPCPGADGGAYEYDNSTNDSDVFAPLGYISQAAPYRVSCQATMWRAEELLKTMREGEDAAGFEINGTVRCTNDGRTFLSVRRELKNWPMQYYCSAISRGEWEPAALEFCKKLGIPVVSTRPVRNV